MRFPRVLSVNATFFFRSVVFVCVLSLVGAIVHGADFYVSPDGSDDYSGTSAECPDGQDVGKSATSAGPFATIARAQQAVRELKAKDPDRAAAIVVQIAGGHYQLGEPLVFGPRDGGNEELTVKYQAAPGQQPLFSGGVRITGWKTDQDGTWHVQLDKVSEGRPDFNELFVNNRRATRARFPNSGYLRVERVGPDKRTSFTYAEGDLPAGFRAKEGEAELVFLHDWSISRVRIQAIDPATRTLTTAHTVGPHAKHYRMDHYEAHPRYFLENHASFLDVPGEWYLDDETRLLTYKPLEGESIENVVVIAPKLTKLMTIAGEPGRPVRNLQFEGLAFAHCAFEPGERYAAGQAAFHEEEDAQGDLRVPTPAAVTLDHARQCQLRHCRVAHVGGTGVWIRQSARDCQLTACHVADVAGNGVMIGEERSRKVDSKSWIQAAPEQATTHCSLTHSLVEQVGQRYFGAVGVWIGMANHITAACNEVRNTPYTGISVGWMWNPTPTPCHHNTIEKNHIHHVMQKLSDGGGIYTLGRQPGTKLVGNVIHDVPRNAGRAGSNGMFLDQGTTDLLITDNIIYNVDRAPLRFHQATTNLSRSNVLVVRDRQPPYRYNNTKATDIAKQDDQVIPAGRFDASDYRDALDTAGPRMTLPSLLPPLPAAHRWQRVWSDEFSGTHVDTSKWEVLDQPRRGERWSPKAVAVDAGYLVLSTLESDHGFLSGAVRTEGKYEKRFGYFETRIKLPREVGHWPAFWLHTRGMSNVGDGGRDGTEIDIMEQNRRRDKINHALHWDGYGEHLTSASHWVEQTGLADGWHVFGLHWTSERYVFYVDGSPTWITDAGGVCQVPVFIKLTEEIGSWAGDITKAELPDHTYVDYVRVYEQMSEDDQ